MTDLNDIVDQAKAAFTQAATPADLENAKALYLGKAGRLTELMKGMAALSVDEKKSRGAAINIAKQAIELALNDQRKSLADAELHLQLQAEALDVTLPGRHRGAGGLHPVTLTLERIESIFGSMGFDVAQGPEIETDWFNFTALNTPEDHPARSMHDTFYVEGGTTAAPHPLRLNQSRCHNYEWNVRVDQPHNFFEYWADTESRYSIKSIGSIKVWPHHKSINDSQACWPPTIFVLFSTYRPLLFVNIHAASSHTHRAS